MSPELKIYLMTLMLPALMDEIDDPMNPKTRSSFNRVVQFCELKANAAAEAFYEHDELKDRHDAMINHWSRVIDEVKLG
tara:strand:+ start:251 stop:487 length:237 start_codon:yes stop_codon:yes gene_type:complete